ncbi:MAG: RnfABCDGE type electron transport complex subunit G [Lachnospiraceae bacterium]|nr:RnfABCDGE type electron transport complex subunit G [Lachnospiraceae bacterium]
MKENIRSVLTLTIITIVAGILLGYVYEITKEPIAAKTLETKMTAYKTVFPEASDFTAAPGFDAQSARNILDDNGLTGETIDECLAAVNEKGDVIGNVMTITTGEGYGGDITISVGINRDGTLNGIEILDISETAGLGMKADTDDFKNQFKNKNVAKFNYTKTGAGADYEIDAISGATITTNACVNAVNAGLAYMQNLGD